MRNRVFNIRKTLNRRGFTYVFIGFASFAVLMHYFLRYVFSANALGMTNFLISKTMFEFIYLAILTPFIIQRLNDIGITKWVALVFWPTTAFEIRNLLLIQDAWDIYIDPFSTPLIVLNSVSFLIFLLLLFKAGRYNKAFKKDGLNQPAF